MLFFFPLWKARVLIFIQPVGARWITKNPCRNRVLEYVPAFRSLHWALSVALTRWKCLEPDLFLQNGLDYHGFWSSSLQLAVSRLHCQRIEIRWPLGCLGATISPASANAAGWASASCSQWQLKWELMFNDKIILDSGLSQCHQCIPMYYPPADLLLQFFVAA